MSAAENKAVFLSYASQDAEAVRRIAEALPASGVVVWFDQNELVGGDAWDAKIRGQIASCALFVPVISAATKSGSGLRRDVQTGQVRGVALVPVEREKDFGTADLRLRHMENVEPACAGLRSHLAGNSVGGVDPAPRFKGAVFQHFVADVFADRPPHGEKVGRLESAFVLQPVQRVVEFKHAERRKRQTRRAGPSAGVGDGGGVIGVGQIKRQQERRVGVFHHFMSSGAK